MRLFQYWNDVHPPADVAEWIDGFRTRNPDFQHELFNEDSALAFIREHHGERVAAAFASIAVPAFQADLFRLCILLTFGGVYIDADNQSDAPLIELVDKAPDAMLFTFWDQINNAFLMFRRPDDAYLRACLDLALDNIENRRFQDCFLAAGPGVLNAVRVVAEPGSRAEVEKQFAGYWMERGFADLLEVAERIVAPTPELTEAYLRITKLRLGDAAHWIGALAPAYKGSDRHWVNWQSSVYR